MCVCVSKMRNDARVTVLNGFANERLEFESVGAKSDCIEC